MDGTEEADIAPVLAALRLMAAEPERWEALLHSLTQVHRPDAAPGPLARELAHVEDLARMVRRPDEGADAPASARPDIGWVALSGRRKVVAANPAAHAAMASLGRLATDQPPHFDDPANAAALAGALDRASTNGQAVIKFDRDGAPPCFALVVPAADLAPLGAALTEDAILGLVFPAVDRTDQLWASVRESFGLTAAEARLARRLKDGRSLREAADELGVSVNTVRNQLRAVFDKMGVTRQSDLVRALAELSSLAGALDGGRAEAGAHGDAPPVRTIVLADGRRLAFREYGEPGGRPVLSFHEGMGSSLLPPGTQDLARRLGLRIIAPERPGFGRSDPRPDYSFTGVAEDMAALCDRLGLGRVRIGAALSGAPSALQTAIRLGPRAECVHLHSGRPPRPVTAARSPMAMFRARIESNPWVLETLFAILRHRVSPAQVERIARRSTAQSPSDRAFLDEHPEALAYVAAYAREALARGGRGPADEIRAFRRGGDFSLAELAAPVVVWHGEEDAFAPLSDLLAFLGDKAGDVRTIPGIGHFLALKHWDTLLSALAAEIAV